MIICDGIATKEKDVKDVIEKYLQQEDEGCSYRAECQIIPRCYNVGQLRPMPACPPNVVSSAIRTVYQASASTDEIDSNREDTLSRLPAKISDIDDALSVARGQSMCLHNRDRADGNACYAPVWSLGPDDALSPSGWQSIYGKTPASGELRNV